MPVAIMSFIVGAMIAGAGVWYWMAHETEQTIGLLALGEASKNEARAMKAYQHEPSSVAIWEFRHLAEMQSEYLRRQVGDPLYLQFGLFLSHGRLAKLYHQQGREGDAQRHSEMAIAVYRQFSRTNSAITNLTRLLEALQKIDESAKQETRYE
jgi:hypothetical protein